MVFTIYWSANSYIQPNQNKKTPLVLLHEYFSIVVYT